MGNSKLSYTKSHKNCIYAYIELFDLVSELFLVCFVSTNLNADCLAKNTDPFCVCFPQIESLK